MEYNGALSVEVARHSERIRELAEESETMAARMDFAVADEQRERRDLREAIAKVEKKVDRLITQKAVVIALVLFVGGGLLAGVPWLMTAQLRGMLLEMKVVELKVAK